MSWFMYLVAFSVIATAVSFVVKRMRGKDVASGGRPRMESTASPLPMHADRLTEDIKATKTSRVVDQVSILEELDKTQPGYRQYCELIGTSMPESEVVAPYSKRPVAYYDLRCYRIDRIGGTTTETLVSQEKSITPFYFTDPSSDARVYVSLDSFGRNCILVNLSNHIEGPQSSFSHAMAASTRGGIASGPSYAASSLKRSAQGLLEMLRGFIPPLSFGPRPAFAGLPAGFSGEAASPACRVGEGRFGKVYAASGHGHGGFDASDLLGGLDMKGIGKAFDIDLGDIPDGLDSFLGLGGSGGRGLAGLPDFGGPRGGNYGSPDLGGMMLGMGLGALMSTISQQGGQQQPQPTPPQETFLGYRIVEDVVPLNYSVYCLGELYKNGAEVYMGASLSRDNPSSYFATKLEAEVLSHLDGR